MRSVYLRLGTGALVALTLSTIGIAQVLPGKAWQRQQDSIERVTVRIDGAGSRCQGGLIVGRRDNQVFVMTAQSALFADLESSLRLRSTMYEGRANAKPVNLTGRLLEQGDGIAAIAIDDAAFAGWVAANVRFDLLGDDTKVMRQDQIYFPSCQDDGRGATRSLAPIMRVQNARFAFQGGDLPVDARESYIGAPLVQAFGDALLVVGLVTNVAERSEAHPLGPDLQRLTSWGATVSLTPPGTRRDCSYRVAVVRPDPGVQPIMFGSPGGGKKEVTVDTAPDCSWTAFADGAPWIAVTASAGSTGSNGQQVGPGTVTVRSTSRNPCDAPFRGSSINVAGQVIRVAQDNTSC